MIEALNRCGVGGGIECWVGAHTKLGVEVCRLSFPPRAGTRPPGHVTESSAKANQRPIAEFTLDTFHLRSCSEPSTSLDTRTTPTDETYPE